MLANQLISTGCKHKAEEVQDIHIPQQVAQAMPQIYNALVGLDGDWWTAVWKQQFFA